MADEKVAPTTTGDATTGGMQTPVGVTTSDASTTGRSGAPVGDGPDPDPQRPGDEPDEAAENWSNMGGRA
jgi:hypothetical protein